VRSFLNRINRKDALALALILAAAFAFVWPLFVPGWIIPQGGGDLVSFLWPTYRYAAEHLTLQSLIASPQSLLWNPTLYSGAPFAADNQTGLFYPPNLLFFIIFPNLPYQALETLVALHLFLAGAGMYLLMRFELIEQSVWKQEAGLAAAIAFMASDVFITHLGNYNIVAVSAYLPLVFLCLRKSIGVSQLVLIERIRWALAGGLLLGIAMLAGHAQMTLILGLACGVYGLYELALQRHWRVLLLGGLAALTALGIAAIALLLAIEMLQYTARTALDYTEASRWSLPPLGLAGMLSPQVFGRGARAFWPPWDRVEFGYIGVAALILAIFARGKATRFYWLLAVIGLLIAFGSYTPVHRVLFEVVPGFSSIRVPARFILLTNFALAILAGYGMAAVVNKDVTETPRRGVSTRFIEWLRLNLWIVGLGLLGALFVLLAPLPLGKASAFQAGMLMLVLFGVTLLIAFARPVLLPLLVFAELFAFGGFVEIDRGDPNVGYPRGPAVEYLLAQPGPFRIDVATSAWQPDAPAVFGIESITGITNPLALAHYDRYYWSVGYRGSPQYNFLNAQFVVADKDSPPADNTFVPIFNEDPDVDIYLNTNAMPRVSLIYNATLAADSTQAFNLIHAPDFNPASQVVLETDMSPLSASAPSGPSNLFYTQYRAGHFAVVAQTPAPAYVVFAEVWYPGWSATINSQPTDIIRANSAFMAVQVPAGESTIEFNFGSPLLMIGFLITLITLIVVVTILLRKPVNKFHA
jgi:hypothetical protein